MKKFFFSSTAAILVMLLLEPLSAKRTQVIEAGNQYGGKTVEEAYSVSEREYRNGLIRIVQYYDKNRLIQQIDSYFREEYAAANNIFMKKQFYVHEPGKEPKLKKAEFYYTDRFADTEGIYKAEDYYDDEGAKSRTAFLFTTAWEKKKNYSRMEISYSNKGGVTKKIFIDSKGNIIATEEKELNTE